MLNAWRYYYKYITNGQWRHSTTSPAERDESGNVNNIIVIGDTASVRPSAQQQKKVGMHYLVEFTCLNSICMQTPLPLFGRETPQIHHTVVTSCSILGRVMIYWYSSWWISFRLNDLTVDIFCVVLCFLLHLVFYWRSKFIKIKPLFLFSVLWKTCL